MILITIGIFLSIRYTGICSSASLHHKSVHSSPQSSSCWDNNSALFSS